MASFHCTVKTGGKGRAGTHFDYIEREGKYSPELSQGKSKLEDLEYKSSGNLPKWAEHDAGIFWRAADEFERSNGATYREIEIALPRELTPEQRVALVEDFINQQIGKGHAFTFAIHIPKAAIEKGDQPHAHIMYSERTLDGIDRDPEQYFKRANSKNPEKGGCKKDSAGTKERLLATRELWAKVQNQHLEKAGFDERVTHLSLKAQGIDRQPEKHLGPIDAKKINAPALVESRTAERELVQVRKELSAIDVTAELAAQREAAAAIAKAQAQAQAQQAQQAEQARAQAQAAHDLATATLAKQEKEDESIRTTAIAALGKSSAAIDRACAFTQSDHKRTSESLGAASANLGAAIQGAQRRELGKHIEVCAPAVGAKLGQIDRVLQQAGRLLTAIVRTVASAAQTVVNQVKQKELHHERNNHPSRAHAPTSISEMRDVWSLDNVHNINRTQDLLQPHAPDHVRSPEAEANHPDVHKLDSKTSELDRLIAQLKGQGKPVQPAKEPAKAIAPPKPEKPATVVLEPVKANPYDTGLTTAADLHLAQRAKDLFAQAQPSYADRSELRRDVGQAVYTAQAARAASEPRQPNMREIERTAKEAQNTRSREAGEREPWPAGQSTCYWDTMVGMATREKREHLDTPRPGGLFAGDAKKAYDATTAKLDSFIEKVGPASKSLQHELQLDIAQRVAAHARQQVTQAPQHAANVSREAALTKLAEAVQQADLAHAPRDQRREQVQERRQERSQGKDFGR